MSRFLRPIFTSAHRSLPSFPKSAMAQSWTREWLAVLAERVEKTHELPKGWAARLRPRRLPSGIQLFPHHNFISGSDPRKKDAYLRF